MANLTKKQELFFNTLKEFISQKGNSPTFSELKIALDKAGLKLNSLNSITQYIKKLEDKNLIQRYSKARGIRLLTPLKNSAFIKIPLFGMADCGAPTAIAENYIEDKINISRKFITGNKDDYFFIKAQGDSMNKEGINSNDLILIRKTPYIKDKDVVLAIINGLATIKKYMVDKDGVITLMPNSTNKTHQPIFLHPDDNINICGKVVKIFKNYNFT